MDTNETYELRNMQPDDIPTPSNTFKFLSAWGIPLFLVIAGGVLALLLLIRVPVIYQANVLLDSREVNKIYNMSIPLSLAHKISTNTPVAIFVTDTGDRTKNIKLETTVKDIFFRKETMSYYAAINLPVSAIQQMPVGQRNVLFGEPSKIIITISRKNILESLF